jgi:hypothetical protein
VSLSPIAQKPHETIGGVKFPLADGTILMSVLVTGAALKTIEWSAPGSGDYLTRSMKHRKSSNRLRAGSTHAGRPRKMDQLSSKREICRSCKLTPLVRIKSLRPNLRASPSARTICAILFVLGFAALAACEERGAGLSVEKGLECARESFNGHPGTFSQRGDSIAYAYESPNGPARVIVTFDERRRPVRTFFESAPHGSHHELMEAAAVIKDCVAYGPKARGGSAKAAPQA